ncbi:MAG: hypothetical protein HRT69_06390 [Flavobacteriaceae bacterium]|nr:hypothetical protein [Flavobacteriaceae bacterium]
MKIENNKRALYGFVIALVIASIAFRVLLDIEFEQTSILFVGIPILITLLVIKYSGTPKSIYGVVFKTLTLFLLMTSILFGEGLVCIIFMAPIFYGVAALIVVIIKLLKNKNSLNTFVLVPIILIIGEVGNIKTTPKTQVVTTILTVNKTLTLDKLNQSPNFLNQFPTFFKLGFPKPIAISGSGNSVGDFRKIQFESKTKGVGTLHLQIKHQTSNSITFELIDDSTHINHWLSWKEITVSINSNEINNTSTITWTTHFTCDLGPSWYFEPIKRYGVEVMNTHLLNTFFKQ